MSVMKTSCVYPWVPMAGGGLLEYARRFFAVSYIGLIVALSLKLVNAYIFAAPCAAYFASWFASIVPDPAPTPAPGHVPAPTRCKRLIGVDQSA